MGIVNRLLFIVPDFNHNSSANGICVQNIIKGIDKSINEIMVISFSKSHWDFLMEFDNGIKILYFPTNNSFDKEKSFFSKLKILIKYFLMYPVKNQIMNSKFLNSTIKEVGKFKPTSIIATYNSIDTVMLGCHLKQIFHNSKLILYILDKLSSNQLNKSFFRLYFYLRILIFEFRLFNLSDKIIIMKNDYNNYTKRIYSKFRDRFYESDFPLFTPTDRIRQNVNLNSKNQFTFIYTGTFYYKLRDPKKLLDLFSYNFTLYKFQIKLFGKSIFDSLLKDYSKNNSNISFFGFKERHIIKNYISDSDILISLGNNKDLSFPSKIIEYLSFNLPIIHFFFQKKDPVNKFLSGFPNCLCLDININPKEFENTFRNFIEKKYRILTPEELDEVKSKLVLNSPQFTINAII